MYGGSIGSNRPQRRFVAVLWLFVSLCFACSRGEGTLELGFLLGEGPPDGRIAFDVHDGTFTVESSGAVANGIVTVDVRLIDAASTEIAASTVTFAAATYGVQDGQTAFDRTDVTVVADDVTELVVPLEFRWGTPHGALDTTWDIQIAPEMTSWLVTPEPILTEGGNLALTVNVRNYNGPPGAGDVDVAGDLFPSDGSAGGTGAVAFVPTFDTTEIVSGFTEEVYAGSLTVPVPQDFRTHLLTLDGTDTLGITANGAMGCTFVLPARASAVADDPGDDAAIDVTLVDLGGPTEVDVTVKDTRGSIVAGAEVHARERGVVANRIAGRTDANGVFVGTLAAAADGGAVPEVRVCVLYDLNSVFHAVRGLRP